MNQWFTKIPIPERKERLVLVATWAALDTEVCDAPYCKHLEHDELSHEFEKCPVCGRALCKKCFGKGVNVAYERHVNECCQECATLSKEEREALVEVRVKLDTY